MSHLTCLALVAAFAAAGCASGEAGSAPTKEALPVVSTLVLPSPSGAPLSVKAAATKYATIVAAHDKAATDLGNARNQQQPAKVARQLVADLVRATDQMVVALAAIPWPTGVRDPMRLFINVLLGNRQAWSDTAHVSYDVDFWLLLDDALGRCVGDAAAGVNRALGLPAGAGCQTAKL
jgi:hypothetical protein